LFLMSEVSLYATRPVTVSSCCTTKGLLAITHTVSGHAADFAVWTVIIAGPYHITRQHLVHEKCGPHSGPRKSIHFCSWYKETIARYRGMTFSARERGAVMCSALAHKGGPYSSNMRRALWRLLGWGLFLVSEVLLLAHKGVTTLCVALAAVSSCGTYRGTSLIRNSAPLGPYSRNMHRNLWQSWGKGCFL